MPPSRKVRTDETGTVTRRVDPARNVLRRRNWDLERAKRGPGFDPSAVLGPSFARRMKFGRGLGSILDRLAKKIVCRSGSRGQEAASIAFFNARFGGPNDWRRFAQWN